MNWLPQMWLINLPACWVLNALQLCTFILAFKLLWFDRYWWVFCRGTRRLILKHLGLVSMMCIQLFCFIFWSLVYIRQWWLSTINYYKKCTSYEFSWYNFYSIMNETEMIVRFKQAVWFKFVKIRNIDNELSACKRIMWPHWIQIYVTFNLTIS